MQIALHNLTVTNGALADLSLFLRCEYLPEFIELFSKPTAAKSTIGNQSECIITNRDRTVQRIAVP
jgi:hypothetical protein